MKKVIQAIPVEITENNGTFSFVVDLPTGQVKSKKTYYSEGKALKVATQIIEYHWYVGH